MGIDAEHVDVSEEVHHERIGGMLEDLGRAPHLVDFPLGHEDDPVGDLEGLFLVVGHEHAGDVNLVVEPQPLTELLPDLGGNTFSSAARVSGEGARECHALALRAPCSTGEPTAQTVRPCQAPETERAGS